MATWDEIKALAADLKRVQLSSTVQKLSERDCVQIVQQLIHSGQLQLIHTADGRAFLTPEELGKELLEEAEVRGGRVNLVDVAASLNVDLSQVEQKAQELVRNQGGLQLVLGQLLQDSYVRRLAQEVNELLWEQGHVTLGELTKQYDLPTAFIKSAVVLPYLGGVIRAQLEQNQLYTDRYLSRHRARIRGYFCGALTPLSVSAAIQQLGVEEKLFHKLLDQLIREQQVAGSLSSGRSQFVPHCFAKAQATWVQQFYRQNGYLELDALKRLGIAEPSKFAAQQLDILEDRYRVLRGCVLGSEYIAQVEAAVHEARRLGSWTDVSGLLPGCVNEDDLGELLHPMVMQSGADAPQLLAGNTCVVTGEQVAKIRKSLEPRLNELAERALKEQPSLLVPQASVSAGHKEEPAEGRRGKKGRSSGGGGGFQGREVKSRHTKKKYMVGKKEEEEEMEEDSAEVSLSKYLEKEELERFVRRALAGTGGDSSQVIGRPRVDSTGSSGSAEDDLEDVPEELVMELVEQLQRPLNRMFQETLRSVFLQTSATAVTRASHEQTQDRLQNLLHHVRVFGKGCAALGEGDARPLLVRHLLRTLGSEITTQLVIYAAAETGVTVDKSSMSAELRLKTVSQLAEDAGKKELLQLHQAVKEEDVQEFYQSLDAACDRLGFMMRRTDKKHEKQVTQELTAQMCSQLEQLPSPGSGGDPALLLLLSVSLVCRAVTNWPLHAPGRAVTSLLLWLRQSGRVRVDVCDQLSEFQSHVVARVKAQSAGDESAGADAAAFLEELSTGVRETGLQWKKCLLSASGDTASKTS